MRTLLSEIEKINADVMREKRALKRNLRRYEEYHPKRPPKSNN